MSSHNNGNKKCNQEKITDKEKNIMEREKKRQFQCEAEISQLEQRSTRDKRLEEQTKQELLKKK